jgi:hypothetical protein
VVASKSGFTAIHAAAETGQLAKIPGDQLTTDLLLTRNDNGDTPLHAAAYEGHLDQIPVRHFTPELLNVRNYDGITVGRLALDRGFGDQIPPTLRPRPPGPIKRLTEKLGITRPPFA